MLSPEGNIRIISTTCHCIPHALAIPCHAMPRLSNHEPKEKKSDFAICNHAVAKRLWPLIFFPYLKKM
jgi:hypothetical protein